MEDLELQLEDLSDRLCTFENQRHKRHNYLRQAQKLLEETKELCGNIHEEATEFVNYLQQARLEIQELKRYTEDELRAAIERTKPVQLDDKKEILLEVSGKE